MVSCNNSMTFFENLREPTIHRSPLSSKEDINWLIVWNIHGNNMVYGTLVCGYISPIYLAGGDWNHGILYDFPWQVGNGKSSQLALAPSFFRAGRYTTRPVKNVSWVQSQWLMLQSLWFSISCYISWSKILRVRTKYHRLRKNWFDSIE